MNLTLSIDEGTLREARRRAEAMGTSVNQLIREYLQQLANSDDAAADAAEFKNLSPVAEGGSRLWKFDRDELHQRR